MGIKGLVIQKWWVNFVDLGGLLSLGIDEYASSVLEDRIVLKGTRVRSIDLIWFFYQWQAWLGQNSFNFHLEVFEIKRARKQDCFQFFAKHVFHASFLEHLAKLELILNLDQALIQPIALRTKAVSGFLQIF